LSAFNPISPSKAVEFAETAGVDGARRLISDFTAAGLIRSYALTIETIEVGGLAKCVRDSAVPVELWHRMIRDGLVDEVWTGGTVRLPGSRLIGGEPEVRITGIRFGDKHLQRMVAHHLGETARPPAASPAPLEAAETVAPTAPIDLAAAPEVRAKTSGTDLSAIPPGALFVSVKQTQAALGLGRTKINELMNDGRLVRSKIDGAVRIEVASIRALGGITP
jgi:hypothetical protein